MAAGGDNQLFSPLHQPFFRVAFWVVQEQNPPAEMVNIS
jgi:hypothetical protein